MFEVISDNLIRENGEEMNICRTYFRGAATSVPIDIVSKGWRLGDYWSAFNEL